jgi:hypothetical protein
MQKRKSGSVLCVSTCVDSEGFWDTASDFAYGSAGDGLRSNPLVRLFAVGSKAGRQAGMMSTSGARDVGQLERWNREKGVLKGATC